MKPPLSRAAKAHQTAEQCKAKYDTIEARPSKVQQEQVEEFLARGGAVKRFKYREPKPSLITFNGGSPINRAKLVVRK